MSKPYRDKKYMSWVHTLPCIVTGLSGEGIEAHHVRMGQDGGMGMKPSDYRCLPLHYTKHRELHNIGERYFWAKHDYNPNGLILLTIIRWFYSSHRTMEAIQALEPHIKTRIDG